MYAERLDLPLPLLSNEAEQVLLSHRWPGITRKLENVLHFALLVSQGNSITAADLELPSV